MFKSNVARRVHELFMFYTKEQKHYFMKNSYVINSLTSSHISIVYKYQMLLIAKPNISFMPEYWVVVPRYMFQRNNKIQLKIFCRELK